MTLRIPRAGLIALGLVVVVAAVLALYLTVIKSDDSGEVTAESVEDCLADAGAEVQPGELTSGASATRTRALLPNGTTATVVLGEDAERVAGFVPGYPTAPRESGAVVVWGQGGIDPDDRAAVDECVGE